MEILDTGAPCFFIFSQKLSHPQKKTKKAGQEEYKALRDQYMRNGDGFMLVFSVIDRKTFVEIEDFYKQIMKIKEKDRFPLVLVGNKCDLAAMREVSADEAREYARNRNIPYLETSAKTRKNVEESFHQVVKEIRCTHAKPKKNPKNKKQACVIE